MQLFLSAIQSADHTIYNWLGRFAGNWVLDRLASQEEANNIFKGGMFFAIYWYFWFRAGADRERRRRTIVVTVIAALLAVIVGRTISFLVPFRVRPMYDPALLHPSYSIALAPNLENWSSFPSDAALYFFALAFGIAYLSRRLTIPILLYTAGWICLPRLYLGVHYGSDIVAGAAIGMTVVWLLLKAERLQPAFTQRLVGFAESSPHWFYPVSFLASFELADLFNDIRNVGRAVLHAARVQSCSGFMRAAFATIGLTIAAGFTLTLLYRKPIHWRALHSFRNGGLRAQASQHTHHQPLSAG